MTFNYYTQFPEN